MIAADYETNRKREFIKKTIKKFSLNLEGLTVFTEAASGNYMYTPLIAALAGARHVYAIAADSKYGKKEEIQQNTLKEAVELGVLDTITVVFEKKPEYLRESDIITNSGFVRPINREMISCLKSTAVISLMWETWELRPEELDLQFCREREILVMGTNEHHHSLNLFRSIGFKTCKLLFDAGFSVYSDKFLLVSSGDYGDSIAKFFTDNDVLFDRIVLDNNISFQHNSLIKTHEDILQNLKDYDAIIIAELYNNNEIVSEKGIIPTGNLKMANPFAKIIYICGVVDKNDILRNELTLYPEDTRSFGYITISADYLGWKPVLELNTAGLKVGEAMAKGRLKYLSLKEAEKYALIESPADNF